MRNFHHGNDSVTSPTKDAVYINYFGWKHFQENTYSFSRVELSRLLPKTEPWWDTRPIMSGHGFR